MEVVPTSVGVTSRGWDEQHLDVLAASRQIGGASTSGFTPSVSAVASRFTTSWERFTDALGGDCEARADGLRAAIRDYVEQRRGAGDAAGPADALPAGEAMTAITLPPEPRVVPALVVDPDAIGDCGGQLLAASAQFDDLGSFVAGGARVGDWGGQGATAYHSSIAPIGRRADAMSLALRGVARRVDAHATELTGPEDPAGGSRGAPPAPGAADRATAGAGGTGHGGRRGPSSRATATGCGGR